MKIGNDALLEKSLTVQGSATLQGGLAVTGTAAVNGAVTATSPMQAPDFIKTSDYRVKFNVKPIRKALELVLKLNPVTYDIDLGYFFGHAAGLIAHEAQEVIHHAVVGPKDGADLQSIKYIELIPYLIRAIQEQQKQIESLKAALNDKQPKEILYGPIKR